MGFNLTKYGFDNHKLGKLIGIGIVGEKMIVGPMSIVRRLDIPMIDHKSGVVVKMMAE